MRVNFRNTGRGPLNEELNKKIAALKEPKYVSWLNYGLGGVIAFPFVYGALLALLQNYNQEWLTVLISWTGRGLDNWVIEWIPAVQRTSADLISQYVGFIPSIRHAYSVGVLVFTLWSVLWLGQMGIDMFTPSFGAKREAIFQSRQEYNYIVFLGVPVFCMGMGLFSLYACYDLSAVEMALDIWIFSFFFPDSLYIGILLLWLLSAVFIGMSFSFARISIGVAILRGYRRRRKKRGRVCNDE